MMATFSPRIVIVDDDKSVRKALSRLLGGASFERESFRFRARVSGMSRLLSTRLHRARYANAGNDRLDLQRHLARVGPDIPVIVITGHDSPSARSESLALGDKHYLAKPIDGDLLISFILRQSAPVHAKPTRTLVQLVTPHEACEHSTNSSSTFQQRSDR